MDLFTVKISFVDLHSKILTIQIQIQKKMTTRSILKTLAVLFILAGFFSACSEDDGPTTESTETTFVETSFFKDYDGDNTDEEVKIVTITDKGEGVGTTTFTKNTVYVLSGLVFVNSGQTLTIEEGTVIKGASGQGENASGLVVARGGKIMASGTANDPIIFTSESDDVARDINGGFHEGGNLNVATRGLWGGVLILGSASLNSTPGETAIEGIPTSETRGIYGGTNDNDDSGTFKYVSIRHGGTDIGAGNEINGLTLGGVGSGTTIEHVEVIANKDDGFEWFGGTVNSKWLVSALCGDDAFDYDEGWRGQNQFWFVYQDGEGDRGGEHDGGTDPETGTPFATPMVYNATFSGNGNNRALTMRDNAGGEYHNSIFVNYKNGVDIELLEDGGQHSWKQYVDGNLKFMNNIVEVTGNAFAVVTDKDKATAVELTAAQAIADAQFATDGNTTTAPTMTNFVPNSSSATSPSGAFFSTAAYKGAFEPGQTKWIDSWTLLNTSGTVQ